MKFKFFLIFLLSFLSNLGFAQNENYLFPRISSSVTVPISISIPEINRLINNSVKGTIYQDNSFTDNDNDQFKVKVDKYGEIKLTALKDNRFLIEVPLQIWAEKGYGAMGKYVYQDTKFNIVMKFISAVEFKNNWTLQTQTTTYGFEWTTKPVLDYGTVKIPIASLIESTLKEQQAKFTTVIDEQIKESFDLKPYLLMVWNNFNAPIQISPEYNTWLKITPKTVYMTPIKIYKDYIKGTVGLDMYSETYIGQIPMTSPLAMSFPNYVLKNDLATDFNLKTTANVTFDRATSLAKQQFVGQEFVLTSEKNKVRITDMRLYPDKQSIILEVDTEGEVKGTSIIKGFPYYDAEKQRIALTDIDFKLKTKNIFHKTITTLFEGKIKRMIANDYGIPMGDIIKMSKESLNESFNKEYYPGIFLKGNVLDFRPSQILLFQDHITVVIDTQANLKLDVDGLSF
jgi:hypothetical protein